MNRFLTILSALLIGSTSVFAQTNVVDDGVPVSITSTWDVGTNLWVGIETSGNRLNIESGGTVENLNTYIGNTVTSLNNQITISSNGVLSSSGNVYVGTTGNSGNSVTISDSGIVIADTVVIAGTNNFNLNRDGTLKASGILDAGQDGFNWNDGGRLIIADGMLTGTNKVDGNDKVLSLIGATWDTETNDFTLGMSGADNLIYVTNSTITSQNGFIGSAVSSSQSNSMVVSDSRLNIEGGNLTIQGTENELIVLSDSKVVVGEVDASSFANGVVVASTNGAVLSVTDDAKLFVNETLSVGSGTNAAGIVSVEDGGEVIAGSLVLSESGTFNLKEDGTFRTINLDVSQTNFNWENGGNLEILGTFSGTNVLDGTGKSLTLDGGTWDLGTNILVVGQAGAGNTITVTNNGSIYVKTLSVNTNNFNLERDGLLNVTGSFDAGQSNFNWADGGNLSVGGDLTGITELSGSEKSLRLNDGSWDTGTNALVIGENGSGNYFLLDNTGTVSSADGFIGLGASSSNNLVEVRGGSGWTNSGNLYVGRYADTNDLWQNAGEGNSLFVESNSVVVVGETTNLLPGGIYVSSTNGAEMHVGAGASVTTEQGFYVGESTNSTGIVMVYGGGSVSAESLVVTNGSKFVLGAEGTLAITADFDVAGQTTNNFTWNQGGHLSVGGNLTGIDGLNETNQILSLNGGRWALGTNELYVGEIGSGNQLSITNGGIVYNGDGYIGGGENSSNNSVTVNGGTWTNSGNLYVGRYTDTNTVWQNSGEGNSLAIDDSGLVIVGEVSTNGLFRNITSGLLVSSTNGAEVVIGDGASVNVASIIRVGESANSTGTVDVHGGSVSAGELLIDEDSEFNLNANSELTVTGDFNATQSGFNWGNKTHLTVGGELLALPTFASDGFVLDGIEKILTLDDGSWNHSSSDLIIGNLGHGNRLNIVAGGQVVDKTGIIGRAESSSNNIVVVGGSGSVWKNVGDVYIGQTGDGNGLEVSSSGRVENVNGYIGYTAKSDLNIYANNNYALVSGEGAVWTNTGSLNIGAAGNSGNYATVEDGGMIAANQLIVDASNDFNLNRDGTLKIASDFEASQTGFNWNDGGSLIVGGDLSGISEVNGSGKQLTLLGGTWTNGAANFTIGTTGSLNRVVLQNGGTVSNANSFIGANDSATNNSVLVTGVGSKWVNSGTLKIGNGVNSGNNVTVSNQGVVSAASVDITTGNSFNLASEGKLDVSGAFNADPASGFQWQDGGHLEVGGSLTGLDGSGTNVLLGADKTLTLAGGSWGEASKDLIVGLTNSGNAVEIFTNATATGLNAFVGLGAGADNNSMLVFGSNAVLTVEETLFVGQTGNSGNSVTVKNNGAVTAEELIISTGNDFNLGSGGLLTIKDDFNADMEGFKWKNGALTVEGSLTGMAVKTNLVVGNAAYLDEERILTLDGSAAEWDNGADNLIVGFNDANSRLAITNGASVHNGNGFIGWGTGGKDNFVYVADGSKWNNSSNLYVGAYFNSGTNLTDAGTGNTLVVDAGARVVVGDPNVTPVSGLVVSSTNGAEMVVGKGALVSVADTLTVGEDTNYTGSVIVRGEVLVGNLAIANTNSSFELSGTLVVENNFDAGQGGFSWNNNAKVSVGGDLSGMATTNGLPDGGNGVYLNGGRDLVLDGGSWTNSLDNLIVGLEGSGSGLSITNGATVLNRDGYIGWGESSANNHVLVTDTNSIWRNQGNLYVGTYRDASTNLVNAGANNSLTVSNGAWVLAGDAAGLMTNTFEGGIFLADSNGVEMVIGKGSTVRAPSDFIVGYETNMTASVTVSNGGTVVVGNLDIRTNSVFDLSGKLTVQGGFNADPKGTFNWLENGEIIVEGALSGITGISGTNQTLTIREAGSWSNMLGEDFTLSGVKNSYTLEDGSEMNSQSGTIGMNSNDWMNSVVIQGSGTVWNVTEDLIIGKNGAYSNRLEVSDKASLSVGGNLALNNGSTFTISLDSTNYIAGNMTLLNSELAGFGTIQFNTNDALNILSISGTNTEISADIVFDAGSGLEDQLAITDWRLRVSDSLTNQYQSFENLRLTNSTLVGQSGQHVLTSFDSIHLNGGVLEPSGGVLRLPSDFTVSGNPLFRITADDNNKLELTNTNSFDLTDLDAEVTVDDVDDIRDFNPVILTAGNGLETNASGVVNAFSETSFIESFPLYSFDLVYSNDQVSVTAKQALDGEISSSLAYAGSEGVRAGFNKMKSAVFTRTKQLRRNVVATAHSIPHEAFLLSNTNAPAGAMGPGDENKIFDMSIWLQQYSGQGTADAYGRSDGFTLNNNGTTIGGDRLFGDSLIAGFNYTYARSDARTTKGDTANTESYWIGGYAEWISTGGLYVDTMLAYGRTDYSTVRVLDGYRGTAKYRGKDFGGYVDVGQYYHYKNLALSPYIGVHVLSVSPDDYTEEGPKGAMNVESDTRSWMESALGLKGRYRFDTQKGRFQTTGYVEWLHDFLQQDVDSRLSVSGIGSVSTARISPDADVLNAGAGFSWICTDYMEIGIGYNGRFSERYEEHTGSMMFDIRF